MLAEIEFLDKADGEVGKQNANPDHSDVLDLPDVPTHDPVALSLPRNTEDISTNAQPIEEENDPIAVPAS